MKMTREKTSCGPTTDATAQNSLVTYCSKDLPEGTTINLPFFCYILLRQITHRNRSEGSCFGCVSVPHDAHRRCDNPTRSGARMLNLVWVISNNLRPPRVLLDSSTNHHGSRASCGAPATPCACRWH